VDPNAIDMRIWHDASSESTSCSRGSIDQRDLEARPPAIRHLVVRAGAPQKKPERRSALRHRGSAALKPGREAVASLCGGDEPQGTVRELKRMKNSGEGTPLRVGKILGFVRVNDTFAGRGDKSRHPMKTVAGSGRTVIGAAVLGLVWLCGRPVEGWAHGEAGAVDVVPLGGPKWTKDAIDFVGGLEAFLAQAPEIRDDLSAAALAALKEHAPFSGKEDAEILQKVRLIRLAVLCAIEAIQVEDPVLADCLLQQYRSNRISLAFADIPVSAVIKNDAVRDCGAEAIRLFKFPCPESAVHLYDPEVIALINTLAHEGLHAVQDHHEGDRTTAEGRARFVLSRQCTEWEASEAEVQRLDALKSVLESILEGRGVPQAARSLAARIGASLMQDQPSVFERDRRARSALGMVCDLRQKALVTRECRQAYKTAVEKWLAGGPDRTAVYNDAIRETGWFSQTAIRSLPEFGSFQISYTAGGGAFTDGPDPVFAPNLEFGQFTDAEDRSIDLSGLFRTISDARISGNRCLLIGTGINPAEGVILRLSDGDGDGFFEAPGGPPLVSPLLAGGCAFDLNWQGGNGTFFAFNRLSRSILAVGDVDGDGTPDTITETGTFHAPLGDLRTFAVSPDGLTAVGFDDPFLPVVPYQVDSISRRDTLSTPFLPSFSATSGPETPLATWDMASANVPPFPNAIAVIGNRHLAVGGAPGRQINLFGRGAGGAPPELLGSVSLSPQGRGTIALNAPISRDTSYFVHDALFPDPMAYGGSTPVDVLPFILPPSDGLAANPPDLFPLPTRDGDPDFLIGVFKHPDDILSFDTLDPATGTYLPSTNFTFTGTDTGLGRGFLRVLKPATRRSGVYRARTRRRPAAVPRNDAFTVAPGSPIHLDLRHNDECRTWDRFEITRAPTIDPAAFTWHGDGTCTVIPTDTGDIEFNYRIQWLASRVSEEAQVRISVDRRSLEFPPPVVDARNDSVSLMVPGIVLADRFYPLYQFRLWHFPLVDICKKPHWHTSGPVRVVFSIEAPNEGRAEPADSCGYGLLEAIPVAHRRIPAAQWEAFKLLHPPL
jgi:hypothetical protein